MWPGIFREEGRVGEGVLPFYTSQFLRSFNLFLNSLSSLSSIFQEIENYVSDRDKNPYKNYKVRAAAKKMFFNSRAIKEEVGGLRADH